MTGRARLGPPAIAVGLGLLLAACMQQPPPVTPQQIARAHATWPTVTPAAVQRGRTLFLSRCSACHDPPKPAKRSPDAWAHQVGKMAKRAHLSADEQTQITAYLRSASER